MMTAYSQFMAGTVALVLLGGGTVAGAQPQPTPNAYEPASCLLFPVVDSRAGRGKGTIISVTNTNASHVLGKNKMLRHGDVALHYSYVADSGPVADVGDVLLTPNDTLTVFAGSHARAIQRGYLFVVAEDPESGRIINYNYLIGQEIVVDTGQNRLWSIPAFGFKCRVTQGQQDGNGRFFADVNRNGSFDFDGVEYDGWPDELYVSAFPNQCECVAESELMLVSGLGVDYRTYVSFDFYNNDEQPFSFSGTYFICWLSTPLLKITAAFGRLGGTRREPDVGWMRIHGDMGIHVLTGKRWYKNEGRRGIEDVPLVGAYAEHLVCHPYEHGHLLHHSGVQNGNEFPWREDS